MDDVGAAFDMLLTQIDELSALVALVPDDAPDGLSVLLTTKTIGINLQARALRDACCTSEDSK